MAWKKTYNLPGKIYAGEWNFVPQAISGERSPRRPGDFESFRESRTFKPEMSLGAGKGKFVAQNAATSTPQACAPRKALALEAKHD
jgi:hypothetical protein